MVEKNRSPGLVVFKQVYIGKFLEEMKLIVSTIGIGLFIKEMGDRKKNHMQTPCNLSENILEFAVYYY